jgi:hypothetical protein
LLALETIIDGEIAIMRWIKCARHFVFLFVSYLRKVFFDAELFFAKIGTLTFEENEDFL